jgi:glycogen operon protein
MVKALHDHDIEVILDVVYNHTGEGDHQGPLYSFKGIDNSTYYLISDRPWDPYLNFSGVGNTLNCANRYVRKMILDSLRYWVREMHVDGFRFDLAAVFSSGSTAATISFPMTECMPTARIKASIT